MKTSEFIRELENLEFVGKVFFSYKGVIKVEDKRANPLMTVVVDSFGEIDSRFTVFSKLSNIQKHQIITLAFEYAATPVEKRKDKTIKEKAKEYIQTYIADDLSFESARDFLECCHLYFNDEDKNRKYLIDAHLSNYSQERLKECSEIYDWYHENSNNFIKMWLEVSEDE